MHRTLHLVTHHGPSFWGRPPIDATGSAPALDAELT